MQCKILGKSEAIVEKCEVQSYASLQYIPQKEVKNMRQNFKMAAAWSEIKPSLSHSILNVMEKLGFQTMTPVQVGKEII